MTGTKHENYAALFPAGGFYENFMVEETTLVIVMQYCDGGDLSQARGGRVVVLLRGEGPAPRTFRSFARAWAARYSAFRSAQTPVSYTHLTLPTKRIV